MPSVHRRKLQRSKSSGRKCLRPGPVGRNPYLNFLREFRKKCCGLSPTKTIQQGAKAWNQLRKEERLRYVEEAFYAPKRRRVTKRHRVLGKRSGRRSNQRTGRKIGRRSSRRMSRPTSRRRSRSRSKSHISGSKKPSRLTIMCNL